MIAQAKLLVVQGAMILFFATVISGCKKPLVGCTDSNYSNYDPNANENNGCCCTIIRGAQDGLQVEQTFSLPFPNISDTTEFEPMLSLHVFVSRMDQHAEGPCGCLEYQGPWGGNSSYDGLYTSPYQFYTSGSDSYGPRSVCYTYVSWLVRPTVLPMDTVDWNFVAAANGLDSIKQPLLINYSLRFSTSGLVDFALLCSDTLRGAMHHNTSSGFALSWGSSWYTYPLQTHRISGTDLSCSDYNINEASITIDSLSVSFLQ